MRACLLALLLLLPLTAHAAPETNKQAPEFAVTAIDGVKVDLVAYRGKIVVLEWNNPGCPFVHKHYDSGNMQKLQAYAQQKSVVWLTINSGAAGKQGSMDAAQAKAYVAINKATPTHYILDPRGTIGHLYDAKTTPHMFVIDSLGNIAYKGAIDDQPTPDPTSLVKAHNYVRLAIDSLLDGKPVLMASTQSYGCSVKYGN